MLHVCVVSVCLCMQRLHKSMVIYNNKHTNVKGYNLQGNNIDVLRYAYFYFYDNSFCEANIVNVNCAQASSYFLDPRRDVPVKAWIFLRQQNVSTLGGLNQSTIIGFLPNALAIWANGAIRFQSYVLEHGKGITVFKQNQMSTIVNKPLPLGSYFLNISFKSDNVQPSMVEPSQSLADDRDIGDTFEVWFSMWLIPV